MVDFKSLLAALALFDLKYYLRVHISTKKIFILNKNLDKRSIKTYYSAFEQVVTVWKDQIELPSGEILY